MGWKTLIFFAFMSTHAVNAFSLADDSDIARISVKGDMDSARDFLADAIEEELKSELSSIEDSAQNTNKSEDQSKSDLKTAGSELHEDIWMERDSDHSSSMADPNENDALHSRDYSNPNKRDDYYEGLEKKSQRSTYVPPPRKIFYSNPDVLDVSASEEDYIPDPKPRARSPSRMSDYDDYYPKEDPLSDIIQAGSRHLLASVDAGPMKDILYPRQMQQMPPWRFAKEKSYPRREIQPAPVNERSRPIENLNVDQLIMKTAPPKPRNNFKMPPAPKRPSARFAPKMRYTDESNFKSISSSSTSLSSPSSSVSSSSSKPWVRDYIKEPVPPKPATHEGRTFLSSAGQGRGTRQQFHEQGTRGPHSYKFGYNTGDRDNPMARYEERDADGIVRGSYSYIDPRGHKQVVNYESHPKFGFKTKISSMDF